MTRAEIWLQSAAAATLGRTLLHSLWEGAAIAIALAIMLCLARSPRLRYAAACGAMLALLAAMIVTFARLFPQEPAHLHLSGIGNHTALPPWDGSLSPLSQTEWKPTDDLAWLAPFWIAGVLIFYLRGLASWIAARRLRNKGVCHAADLWQERIPRLASRLNLTRPVILLESFFADVPVVIGYLKPVILVPVGLMAGLPAGQVEAILLHELAHIRRFDYLVNLLQVFVEGLLFYHPAVWWISGVIRAERENCCDDLVVAATGSAIEYATALASLEQRRENAGMALAATGGGLVKRIQRLLGRKERGYAGAMPVFTAAILTVTVVAALGALQTGQGLIHGVPGGVTKSVVGGVVGGVQNGVTSGVIGGIPGGVGTGKSTIDAPVKSVPGPITEIAQAEPGIPEQSQNQAMDQYMRMEQFYKLAQATALKPLSPEQRKAKEDALRRELATPYKKWLDDDAARIISAEEKKAFAQAQQPPAAPGMAQPMTLEQLKMYQPTMQPASGNAYNKWISEDVVYIISDEEKKAFAQLTTDTAREQFVQDFWARRDPTPGTEENEFKEEHYRRIAYANEHYAASVPGWRTDRGRIYIQYGPPNQIEAHSGEGVTYPFEQWRYRFIDGVGQNIIIEFVDKNKDNEYRMTMDPSEKDALRQVQGASPVK